MATNRLFEHSTTKITQKLFLYESNGKKLSQVKSGVLRFYTPVFRSKHWSLSWPEARKSACDADGSKTSRIIYRVVKQPEQSGQATLKPTKSSISLLKFPLFDWHEKRRLGCKATPCRRSRSTIVSSYTYTSENTQLLNKCERKRHCVWPIRLRLRKLKKT